MGLPCYRECVLTGGPTLRAINLRSTNTSNRSRAIATGHGMELRLHKSSTGKTNTHELRKFHTTAKARMYVANEWRGCGSVITKPDSKPTVSL